MIGAVPGARGHVRIQIRIARGETPVLAKYTRRPAHPLTEGRPYVIEFENYSKTLNNVL